MYCTGSTLGGGFVEDDHFGFERGDCQAVAVTGGLGRMDESQVGMVTLDGVNEVGDVEAPKEGRETTVFRQVFEDLDVGGVVGETFEDTVHDGVMECVDALTEVRWDMVIMESNKDLVSGDGREIQFDSTEEYDGGVVTVGEFMLVGDV
jgi:hypothetical protein